MAIASGVGGRATPIRSICVTRWEQDGKPDKTFGTNGLRSFGFTSSGDNLDWDCVALAEQPGGEVLLTGAEKSQPSVWRFDASVALDTDFGRGGVCSLQLQEVTTDRGFAVMALPNGKIRIACTTGLVQFATRWVKGFHPLLDRLLGLISLLSTFRRRERPGLGDDPGHEP